MGLTNASSSFIFQKKAAISITKTRVLDLNEDANLLTHRDAILMELKKKSLIDRYQTYDFSLIKTIISSKNLSYKYSINSPTTTESDITFNNGLSVYSSSIIKTPVINPNSLIDSSLASVDRISNNIKFWIFNKRNAGGISEYFIYYLSAPTNEITKFLDYDYYSSTDADSIDIYQLLKSGPDTFTGNASTFVASPVANRPGLVNFNDLGSTTQYFYFTYYPNRTYLFGKEISASATTIPTPSTEETVCLYRAVTKRIYSKYLVMTFGTAISGVQFERTSYKGQPVTASWNTNIPIKNYYYYSRYGEDSRNNYFFLNTANGSFKLGSTPLIRRTGGTFNMQINALPRGLDVTKTATQTTTEYNLGTSAFAGISSLNLKTSGPISILMRQDPHQPYFSDLINLMNYQYIYTVATKTTDVVFGTSKNKDNVWDGITPTNDDLVLNTTAEEYVAPISSPGKTACTWKALKTMGFIDDVQYFANSPIVPQKNITYNVMKITLPLDSIQNEEPVLLNKIKEELVKRKHIPSDSFALSNLNLIDNERAPIAFQGPFETNVVKDATHARVFSPSVFFTNEERNPNLFTENNKIAIQIPPAKIDTATNTPIKRYVKVKRLSHETLSSLINKAISLEKVTEIIPQNFSYPFSAIVGTKIDSRAFSQIPVRTFDCKLKKVLVPSNYFPNNANGEDLRYLNSGKDVVIYSGDWDGTFKLSWTNNPAWILMDILINKRYGLGNYIESEQVDVWELYKIARWCDAVDENGKYLGVPDAYGGIEPRHAFNAIIKDKFNVFDMLNQIASVFRGHVYYMNSLITFEDDRPKDPIGEFNNSDVKDGLFNYANHKKDDEYTAVDVLYNDEKDNFKPKIEFVEDSEGIRKRGILKKEINAFGITSKSQARRMGSHFLYQTSKENLNVSFTTDLKALLYRPGDFISINDELINSKKNFGVIKNVKNVDADKFCVVIDKLLDKEIFDEKRIALHIPKIKPKYEDLLYKTEYYPDNLIVKNLTFLEKYFKSIQPQNSIYQDGLLSHENTLLPLNNADGNKSYTGLFKGNYKVTQNGATQTINFDTKVCFSYIQCYNMNDQVSEYGHWEVKTGSYAKTETFFKIDSLRDPLIKFELPHKKYFFEYIDTGLMMKFSKTDTYGSDVYTRDSFSFTNFTSNKVVTTLYNQLNVSNYSNYSIKFADIIETDRPSVESFKVLSYETGWVDNSNNQTPYSILSLSKYGTIESNNTQKIKTSVDTAIKLKDILIGSSYSMSFKNQNNKIFKVMSINEDYVNEYSIFATEYDSNKFCKIEGSSASYLSIHNTFNFLNAYEATKNQTTSETLKSPIIENFSAIDLNANLLVQWKGVTFAQKYKIYLKTPSKQTSNFQAEVLSTDSSYNKDLNLYSFKMVKPREIGTFTIVIEAYSLAAGDTMAKFSPPSSMSINLLEY